MLAVGDLNRLNDVFSVDTACSDEDADFIMTKACGRDNTVLEETMG